MTEREIFEAAIRITDQAERERFVEKTCRGNATLRSKVEALLRLAAERTTDAVEPGAGPPGPQPAADDDGSARSSRRADPLIGQSIGGVKLVRVINEGGMGRVYEGRQDNPRRTVAVKLVKPGVATEKLLRRFEFEAQVLARLRHPGIAEIFYAGTFGEGDAAQPYFVMEYIANAKPITQFADDLKLSTHDRLELFRKVCDAVAHGHLNGVIHRDLKPSNILVDASGQPKVIDFGVAKTTDSDMALTTLQTDVGALIGTYQYMSPEQFDADPHAIDVRSDVYALGVVLYELLAGQSPYDLKRKLIHEIGSIVRQQEPTPLTNVNKTLRRDVGVIAGKCLEKNRTRRYSSAGEVAADIGRYLAGEPIAAVPPSVYDTVVRLLRRHRGATAAAVAIAATLVAATLTGAVLQARAQRQRRDALAAAAVTSLLRVASDRIGAAVDAATEPELAGAVEPRLREAFAAATRPAEKVRAAIGLARLPAPPDEVWTTLAESLLAAAPAEVAPIRAALAPHGARFTPMFWERAQAPGRRGERLRAAAALAEADPEAAGWSALAPAVAADLVTAPAVDLATWLEAFRGVRRKVVPALVPIFADPGRREVERALAADILAELAADDPATLADLAMTAEPGQFAALARSIDGQAAGIAPILEAEIAKAIPAGAPPVAPEREALGIRQAKAAAVLVRLGRPERAWPLFIHSPDPRVRSYLIHFLKPFAGERLGAVATALVARLGEEPDTSAKRAIVLALGEVLGGDGPGADGPDATDFAALRGRVVPALERIFETDPDPGLHAAAEWTLGRVGGREWLAERHAAWRAGAATGREPPDAGPRSPRWFVNGQGQTMVVIPGPVEFLMGATPEADGTIGGPPAPGHRRRIGRTFAISAAHVTLAEYEEIGEKGYRQWLGDKIGGPYARSGDLPVCGTNWFKAAAYCNALSRAEGIPESEWVYEQDPGGRVTALASGWMSRRGYRLPTEAEWEYASRAGAVTSRFYGQTAALLGAFAWYQANSGLEGTAVPWPVGEKKPNDLGLFDGLGNVWDWCHGPFDDYPEGAGDDDDGGEHAVAEESRRIVRGGSFDMLAPSVRSAYRSQLVPSYRAASFGFRVAKTIVPGVVDPPQQEPARGADGEIAVEAAP